MAILTDLKARHLKPADNPVSHGGVTGLALHPSSTKGHGKWVLRYISPFTGKRRNTGLGTYPEVSIAEAAQKALLMRQQISAGQDPLEQKKILEPAQPTVPTFEDAATTVHAERLPGWKNHKHGQQWINTLTQDVFPIIGSLPLDLIQPRHIADALRPTWLEKPETSSRIKQRIHAVMAWGWAHGHCLSNPVDVVTHLLPQQPSKTVRLQHQPAMPWRVIPSFIAEHVRNRTRYDVTRAILEFLILTAARSGEVRGMTWAEVDLNSAIWTIPAERMKAEQQHRVPISSRALEILRNQQGLHDILVFPSIRKGTQLSDMVITAFLRRVQAPSDVANRVATAHGFRSSFRDWCSEQGCSRDLAERSLAHTVKNKVEAAYHRTDLLEQRRPLMNAWAEYIGSRVTSGT